MTAAGQTPISTTPEGYPSSGLRSVITYLLFVHFFFLLVGIKSRTDSSGLEQDLRNKVPGLRPYLQLLGMDLSYMFHLTYYQPTADAGDPNDTDFFLEADIPQPDGTTKLVVLPTKDELAGMRFRRMERLVHAAAVDGADGSDSAAEVAKGIARRLMLENNCLEQARTTPLRLRFRRRILPDWMLPPSELEQSGALEVPQDAPSNFETVYEVLAVFAGDDVQVTRVGAASNAAAPSQAGRAGQAPGPNLPQSAPSGTATPAGTSPSGTGTPPLGLPRFQVPPLGPAGTGGRP